MCLWNTDSPDGNKVKIWQKSLRPTFWPCPQGQVISEKCEEPIDEPKFGYFIITQTLNIALCL